MTADRDRVTAILTLVDERDALMKNLSPTRTELGKMADADMALTRALRSNGPWLARTLLEALDTIDKQRTKVLGCLEHLAISM